MAHHTTTSTSASVMGYLTRQAFTTICSTLVEASQCSSHRITERSIGLPRTSGCRESKDERPLYPDELTPVHSVIVYWDRYPNPRKPFPRGQLPAPEYLCEELRRLNPAQYPARPAHVPVPSQASLHKRPASQISSENPGGGQLGNLDYGNTGNGNAFGPGGYRNPVGLGHGGHDGSTSHSNSLGTRDRGTASSDRGDHGMMSSSSHGTDVLEHGGHDRTSSTNSFGQGVHLGTGNNTFRPEHQQPMDHWPARPLHAMRHRMLSQSPPRQKMPQSQPTAHRMPQSQPTAHRMPRSQPPPRYRMPRSQPTALSLPLTKSPPRTLGDSTAESLHLPSFQPAELRDGIAELVVVAELELELTRAFYARVAEFEF